MKNIIKEMQLICLEWISDNHLEEEYNHYWVNCIDLFPGMPFTAIGFAIHYGINHPEELLKGDDHGMDL